MPLFAILRGGNSRFGAFNSRLGPKKFPFDLLREFAGKPLNFPAIFGAGAALFGNNRKNSRFPREQPGIPPRISAAALPSSVS